MNGRPGEVVVLLHGLARTRNSLRILEFRLKREGFNTINLSYPSTKKTIEILASETIARALSLCPGGVRIHFVTHSMGGLLIRYYLLNHSIGSLGRVVMLGPPNQGSEVVDRLKDMPGFKLINGKAGVQLGTDANSLPAQLGPVDFELGVIAGSRSISCILSSLLPAQNDGKVSVDSTKVAGMKDHLVLPVTHTFMMNSRVVAAQVSHFLKTGAFESDRRWL
ncbi:MAG: alpha/beta hydrolase [Gammaproteobacteria bacterium]|nr:MAG: alpha/beta hydrolase [Gammaproteobacteria bacterium]